MDPRDLERVLAERDRAERRRQTKRSLLMLFVGVPVGVVLVYVVWFLVLQPILSP